MLLTPFGQPVPAEVPIISPRPLDKSNKLNKLSKLGKY